MHAGESRNRCKERERLAVTPVTQDACKILLIHTDEGPLADDQPTIPPRKSSPITSSVIETPQLVQQVIRKIRNKDISLDPGVIKGFDLICDSLLCTAKRTRYLEHSFRDHFILPKKYTKRPVDVF